MTLNGSSIAEKSGNSKSSRTKGKSGSSSAHFGSSTADVPTSKGDYTGISLNLKKKKMFSSLNITFNFLEKNFVLSVPKNKKF